MRRTIKLMADYQCWPLWEERSGLIGNLNPADLRLSGTLRRRLDHWRETYDASLDPADPRLSGFADDEACDRFKREGRALGDALRRELGPDYGVTTEIRAYRRRHDAL
jgi:hypothetical protein